MLENKRRWRAANREWARVQAREGEKRRYAADPQVRAKCNARTLQNAVLRGADQAVGAIARFEALVGCSVQEFRAHLEKQFVDGMCWENRGRQGWHIDHKRPLSGFDLTDPLQLAAAFHYKNTQPLWADENRRKMVS